VIENRWRAVEADIQRWYGVDARFCGARRLVTLIAGLPEGAATHGGAGWLLEHELQATLLEVMVAAWADRKKMTQPFRVPRPERDRPKKSARDKLIDLARVLKGGS
jgi:hypothetical protein